MQFKKIMSINITNAVVSIYGPENLVPAPAVDP